MRGKNTLAADSSRYEVKVKAGRQFYRKVISSNQPLQQIAENAFRGIRVFVSQMKSQFGLTKGRSRNKAQSACVVRFDWVEVTLLRDKNKRFRKIFGSQDWLKVADPSLSFEALQLSTERAVVPR